jgi:transcriptional regulator with XRE-family HTH domain
LVELSRATGMGYSFLSGLENDKHSITIANLQKIANFFGVNLVYFLQQEEEYNVKVTRAGESEKFELEIYAHRCCESVLSKIQIMINANIYKEFYLNRNEFHNVETLEIAEDSFILVKCYDCEGNLGMTNPVYIRNKPFLNKGYLSHVCINVYKNGNRAQGYYSLGESGERLYFDGTIRVSMKAAAKLHVEVNGKEKTIRLFELPELQDIFRNLYFGRFNKDKRYNPGEVPASEFKLSRIREILDNVELELNF